MIKAEADIKDYGTYSNGTWSNVRVAIKYPIALPNGNYQTSSGNPLATGDFIVDNNGFVWKVTSCSLSGTDYICSIIEQSVSSPSQSMRPDNILEKGLVVTPNSKGLLSPYYHDSYVTTNSFRAAMSYSMKQIGSTNTGGGTGGGTTGGIPTSLILGNNSRIYGDQLLMITDVNNYSWILGSPYYLYEHPYRNRTENYTLLYNSTLNKIYSLTSLSGRGSATFTLDNSTNRCYVWGNNEFGGASLGHSNIIDAGIYDIKGTYTLKKISASHTDSAIAIDTNNYILYMGQFISPTIKELLQYNNIFNRYPYIDVCAIATVCMVIASDGSIWTFGYNLYGQLGTGSMTPTFSSTPVKVASALSFKKVFGRHMTCYAIDSQDYLWTWGEDAHYILSGLGNSTGYSTVPVKVSNVLRFSKVCPSENHCIGLTTDGEVYGWGDSSYGQVGNGITSGNKIVYPTKCINLGKCVDIAVCTGVGNPATDFACPSYALDINNRLWGWGKNGYRNNGATPYPYYFGPSNKGAVQLSAPTIIL